MLLRYKTSNSESWPGQTHGGTPRPDDRLWPRLLDPASPMPRCLNSAGEEHQHVREALSPWCLASAVKPEACGWWKSDMTATRLW